MMRRYALTWFSPTYRLPNRKPSFFTHGCVAYTLMWNFCFLGPSPRLHKMPENSAKKGQRLLSLQIIIWYSTAYAAHWLQETAGGAESGTNPKPHLVRCGEHAARWRLAAAAPSRGPRKLRDAFKTT